MVVLVRNVPNPTADGPRYKIMRELEKLPLPTTDYIVKMSTAMQQLCIYLKHNDLQEQRKLVCGDFLEIRGWVPYWLQSGVSPLILLAVVVYVNHREDPTLANPNFYYTVTDGLRNMVNGEWGYVKIEQSALDGSVVDFISECNRFMGAWCARAMGGEGSSAHTSIVGENKLLEECMIKRETADVSGFDLAWIRLFWNRTQEVFKDPMIGPPGATTLRDFLDKTKQLTKGLLSNPIFAACRETCWYVVEGAIVTVSSMLAQQERSPDAFLRMRPNLAQWNHLMESLHRCGRILGTAMRIKEYSLHDLILMLRKNKEAGADDIPDQVCLAYGHALYFGIHLEWTLMMKSARSENCLTRNST